jgi:hypothetical protein
VRAVLPILYPIRCQIKKTIKFHQFDTLKNQQSPNWEIIGQIGKFPHHPIGQIKNIR